MKKPVLLLLSFGLSVAAQAQTPARDLIKEGVALYDAGKYDEAIAKYQQVLATEPGNTTALSELALTYDELGRNAEAVAICEKLVKADPRVGEAVYVTYGNSLDALKKPREAGRIYEQGLKYFPDSYSLHYNEGVAQVLNNQVVAGVGNFQQAVAL